MTVNSVTVNGHAAAFTFVQPTYPGDPNGQDDPNPQAHEVSQNNPVGGPANNPLPPACSPELPNTDAAADSQNGQQCPANKLRQHLPRVARVLAQEAGRQAIVPLSRAMASRSAAASGRSPNVSDSTGPLNQWPRGHRILVLSSGPSVDLIR